MSEEEKLVRNQAEKEQRQKEIGLKENKGKEKEVIVSLQEKYLTEVQRRRKSDNRQSLNK